MQGHPHFAERLHDAAGTRSLRGRHARRPARRSALSARIPGCWSTRHSAMSPRTPATRPTLDLNREARRFFELSQDMVCIAGTDLYFKHLNSVWEHTLGF